MEEGNPFFFSTPSKTIGVLFMAIFAISAPTSKKKKCWENPTFSLVVKNGKLFGGSSYPYLLTFCFVRPIIKRQFVRFYCIADFYCIPGRYREILIGTERRMQALGCSLIFPPIKMLQICFSVRNDILWIAVFQKDRFKFVQLCVEFSFRADYKCSVH